MRKIILFGDSITAGYKNGEIDTILNDTIARLSKTPLYITNAGIPGDTTVGALRRVAEHVTRYEPDVVVVFFGTNDASELSGITLTQYERNLEDLVTLINPKRVVLLGPSYTDQTLYHNDKPIVRLTQYNNAVSRVAKRYSVPYIDILREMMQDTDPRRYLQADGLHFSKTGYDLLAHLIVESLKERV